MGYYLVCICVIVAFFFLLFKQLFVDLRNTNSIWLKILFCLLLTIVFKFDFGTTFCGLEYEDSYAFSFLAREFANGIYTQSFLSEGIGIGSLDSPVLMQTYGGHFITYSVLLSIPIKLFGFSSTIVSLTTSLLQFLALIILVLFQRSDDSYKWMIAPVIYCISPIINVFGNSFLCEPFSSLLVLSYVYLYYKQKENTKISISVTVAFFLAILAKRENLVLFVIPLIHYGYFVIKEKKLYHKNKLISLACYCILLLVYFSFIQNVFDIESTEAQDIESPTFSFVYFQKLAPVFIKSLINPSYFGVTTIILLYLISRSLYLKTLNIKELAIFSCWVCYFLLYTFHYRGYFFIQGEPISEFETFRYLNNFYCLIPIIVTMHLSDVRNCKCVYSAFIILLLSSIYPTISLRQNFSEEEWYSRFYASQETINIIQKESSNSAVVISPEILTLQNIGDNSLFVCDASYYDKMDFNNKRFQYYLLCRNGDIDYLRQRYGLIIDINKWDIHKNFKNGFTLYKYHSFK